MELKQGTELQGGKYVIKQVLGQGGFGITYLAEQVSLKCEVAIKEFFMKDNCLRDDATGAVSVPSTGSAKQVGRYYTKFLKEAQTMSALNHPHIIKIIDVFEEKGTAYYVMPFMPNGSLKDWVEKHGRLSEQEALNYIQQIAQALKYMHEKKRLCHYDVKPGNIMLDENMSAVLIDFGISKYYDTQGNQTSSTPVGTTEGYAPIEQYKGIDSYSPASDVYALGATLYFLVMGTAPPTAVARVQSEQLKFSSAISAETRLMIGRAMKLNLRERSQNVDAFLTPRFSSPQNKKATETENPIIDSAKPSKSKSQSASPKKAPLATDAKKSEEESPKPKLTFKEVLLKVFHAGKYLYITGLIGLLLFAGYTELQTRIKRSNALSELESNMVRVEGGTFTMGATAEQADDANEGEYPPHQVTLSGFYICKYEVTQELWKSVMGSNPSKYPGDLTRPVECVSWEDCQEFITKLNEMTGKHYRLPTEAEWEFAARGGNKSKGYKYSGSDSINDVAWYNCMSSYTVHHPVGQKKPNELGLYDMSGNVNEWCQDWYGDYGSESQTDPTSSSSGSNRVCRGGGWEDNGWACRVSCRRKGEPSVLNKGLGLRLAMDAD